MGWDSVDVDDRLIFKFPRHEAAKAALIREARLLSVVRPAVTMPVPELTLHDGLPLFSRHEKLKGEHLVTAQYLKLAEEASRDRPAADMALFFAELHHLDARHAGGRGGLGRGDRRRQRHDFSMTAQASRSPASPEGWLS